VLHRISEYHSKEQVNYVTRNLTVFQSIYGDEIRKNESERRSKHEREGLESIN
jgi:hypothetical protein